MNSFWRWQAFKLIYVLCIIFVMPTILIGGCAVYLAIYEPEQLRKSLNRKPPVQVDPLESPSYFTRHDALKKLTTGPADRSRRDVAEKIKKLLRDSNPQNQELAIEALGKWGTAEDVPALRELAADQFSFFIRPSICKALGNIPGEESLEGLIDILGMGNIEGAEALTQLRKSGPAAEAALLRRGESAEPAFKAAICSALGQLGTGDSEAFLTEAAAGEDAQVAAAAKQALGALAKKKPL
jgi:HEAT repeat protein